MKKVKILSSSDPIILEKNINEFIEDKELIDIKFTSLCLPEYEVNDRAIIIYEERLKNR